MAKNGRQGEGGGRPAVEFDDKDIAQVEALASVMTKGQIADYFGIEENTLRAVERRQPEVFEAYKKGKARAILKVSQNLLAQYSSYHLLFEDSGWLAGATRSYNSRS